MAFLYIFTSETGRLTRPSRPIEMTVTPSLRSSRLKDAGAGRPD